MLNLLYSLNFYTVHRSKVFPQERYFQYNIYLILVYKSAAKVILKATVR